MTFINKKCWSLVVLAMAVLGLVACSSSDNNSKLDEKAIVNSFIETSQKIESAQIDSSMKLSTVDKSGHSEETMGMDLNGELIVEPLQMHVQANMRIFSDITMEYYLQGESIYMLVPTYGDDWFATTLEEAGLDAQINSFMDMSQGIEKLKGHLAVVEDGDTYVLTFTGDEKALKDYLVGVMGATDSDISVDDLEETNFENVSIQYVIEKGTYYPISVAMNIDVTTETSDSMGKIEIAVDYSKVNEISEIILSEAAKSAADTNN